MMRVLALRCTPTGTGIRARHLERGRARPVAQGPHRRDQPVDRRRPAGGAAPAPRRRPRRTHRRDRLRRARGRRVVGQDPRGAGAPARAHGARDPAARPGARWRHWPTRRCACSARCRSRGLPERRRALGADQARGAARAIGTDAMYAARTPSAIPTALRDHGRHRRDRHLRRVRRPHQSARAPAARPRPEAPRPLRDLHGEQQPLPRGLRGRRAGGSVLHLRQLAT